MGLRIQQIACSTNYTLVLLSDGSLWATGDNEFGQLGDGTRQSKSFWISVMDPGSGVTQITAGGMHSLALKSDGSVWATGDNEFGQLGDGTRQSKSFWISVMDPGSGVTQITAGGMHSLALKSDGSIWGVGDNEVGQLGDGTTTDKSNWASLMSSGSGVIQVAAGHTHSLALSTNGSVWAAGHNGYGELGDGSRTDQATWISVISSGATRVAVGSKHSLVLMSNGELLATGYNFHGQLGRGRNRNKATWISVIPSGVVHVAAGRYHSFAVKSDGSVWASGDNENGQLGDGTYLNKSAWKPVMNAGTYLTVGGYDHSFAVKADGTIWKTGGNYSGQLGHEGDVSTVWIPDRFFEQILLESLMDESKFEPDFMTDPADNWRGLSL